VLKKKRILATNSNLKMRKNKSGLLEFFEHQIFLGGTASFWALLPSSPSVF